MQAASTVPLSGAATWHLALGKLFDEIGIMEGGEAVSDALGAKVERAPH